MERQDFYRIKKARRAPRQIEQSLQEQYTLWLDSLPLISIDRIGIEKTGLVEDRIAFCASAGGMRAPRYAAIRMKRAGYKKGHPDIVIYEPRAGWHGMAVETKVGQYPSQEQKEWQRRLLARGYYAIIVPGRLDFWEARKYLENETLQYLQGQIRREHGKE